MVHTEIGISSVSDSGPLVEEEEVLTLQTTQLEFANLVLESDWEWAAAATQ